MKKSITMLCSFISILCLCYYGLRKYKNQIKEDEEIAKELQNGNISNTTANSKD